MRYNSSMAAAPVLERRITAQDLLEMDDGGHYELVDGCLVERNVSYESGRVITRITGAMDAAVHGGQLGELVDGETGMRLHPTDPDRTRRPDLAFISRERAPLEDTPFLFIAPELVVEVVSPGDREPEVQAKVREWLGYGVRVVWVVYPVIREVHEFRSAALPQVYSGDMVITCEDLIPGFAAPVSRFFARSGA